MNHNYSYYIILGCIFLPALICAGASAVTVTVGPEYIQDGDTITIDFQDLTDESIFALRMQSGIDTGSAESFAFEATNVTLPFSLHNPEVYIRAEPVASAGLRAVDGGKASTIEVIANNGLVDYYQGLDDVSPGTIDLMRLFGEKEASFSVSNLTLQLEGKKSGVCDGNITFGLQGINEGKAKITVLVDDSIITSEEIFVGGTPPVPVVDFTADNVTGKDTLTVQFSDLSTISPFEWSWDFGDGSTSTDQNPEHMYTSPGVYDVALTATNAGGSNITTKYNFIIISSSEIGSVLTLPNTTVPQNGYTIIPFFMSNCSGISELSGMLSYDPEVVTINDYIVWNSAFEGTEMAVIYEEYGAGLKFNSDSGFTSGDQTVLFEINISGTGVLGATTHLEISDPKCRGAGGINYGVLYNSGTITIGVKGDFNGNDVIDIGDVSKVAYMVAGKEALDPAADFNENYAIDVGDAAKIAYFFIGNSALL